MVLFDLPLTKALTIALFIPAYVWFVNYQGCMPLKCSVRPACLANTRCQHLPASDYHPPFPFNSTHAPRRAPPSDDGRVPPSPCCGARQIPKWSHYPWPSGMVDRFWIGDQVRPPT